MKSTQLFKKVFAGSLALASVLAISTTAFAAKTKVADVSQYQGNINWSKASKDLKMTIIRVKHGNAGDSDYRIDTKRNVNANGAAKYGVPFGQYDYAEFDSVADAQKDARQFYALSSTKAKFLVLDNEKRKSGVKSSEQTYVNAWLKTMRSLTNKPLVYYTYESFVTSHKINYSKFDGAWLAKYSSAKPKYTAALWQYTSTGSLSGISGHVDLSKIQNSSTVANWTKSTKATYMSSVKAGQKIRATRGINRYKTANLTGKIAGVKYNTTLTAKTIAKSSGGTYRIQLSDGSYITANKAYVQAE